MDYETLWNFGRNIRSTMGPNHYKTLGFRKSCAVVAIEMNVRVKVSLQLGQTNQGLDQLNPIG